MKNINTNFSGIIKLTIPLVISGLAMNLVGIIDLILVSGLGESQVGGTGNGQILYTFYFLSEWGLLLVFRLL